VAIGKREIQSFAKLQNPNHRRDDESKETGGECLEVWNNVFQKEEKGEFKISLKPELRRDRPSVIAVVTRRKKGPKESL
jgi:hypothetical protein